MLTEGNPSDGTEQTAIGERNFLLRKKMEIN